VLYDRHHTAEFADADLAFNLPDLYRKESDLIVVVLCGEYVEREWCGLGWRAIYSHIKNGNSKQVMLFRADDTEIRGLHDLEGFVPVDAFTPDEAVTLILQRLARNEGKCRDFYLKPEPKDVGPVPTGRSTNSRPVGTGPTSTFVERFTGRRSRSASGTGSVGSSRSAGLFSPARSARGDRSSISRSSI